jgi:CHASE2 domain-containing sensor protein
VSPLTSRQMTWAWLLTAIAFLGFLGVRTITRPRPPTSVTGAIRLSSTSVVVVGQEPGPN